MKKDSEDQARTSSSNLSDAGQQKKLRDELNQIRKDVQSSFENVQQLKVKVDRLNISWLEEKRGCFTLKSKLQSLLSDLLLELKTAKQFLRRNFHFDTHGFCQFVQSDLNNLEKIKLLKPWFKRLLGVAAAINVVGGMLLLGGMAAAALQAAEITMAQAMFGIAAFSGFGILIGFVITGIVCWVDAGNNKEKLQDAILKTENALKHVRTLI